MRAAIYRRVSTGRQARDGASLDQQRETCAAYAERQGWSVVEDYAEAGRSAYAEDLRRRPAFQQMIADARGRRFDVLLVYELSRFARRSRVQFSVAGDLEALGIRVISVTEPMDPTTIEGFVTYSVLAMQAELHSRLLARRMTSVRQREAEAGQLAQPAPRGMRWLDGRLVWDDAAAELPRRAFALAATGLGTPRVQAALRDEGHIISLQSLHYLLNNPAYAGMLRHKGRVLPASWPALIDRATWDAVQALRRARHPQNAVRATVRATAAATLAGLAYCANCGAKLYYEHHTGKRCYYACSARDNGGHCNARPSRADRLDAAVSDLVSGLDFPAEVVEAARGILEAEQRPAPPRPRADNQERLRRLARAYADGAYTDAEYAERRSAIAATNEPQPEPAASYDLDVALGLLRDIPALWGAATASERRALLSHLVSHVYARRGVVYAVRPTRAAAPLLEALWTCRATSHLLSLSERSPVLLAAA